MNTTGSAADVNENTSTEQTDFGTEQMDISTEQTDDTASIPTALSAWVKDGKVKSTLGSLTKLKAGSDKDAQYIPEGQEHLYLASPDSIPSAFSAWVTDGKVKSTYGSLTKLGADSAEGAEYIPEKQEHSLFVESEEQND